MLKDNLNKYYMRMWTGINLLSIGLGGGLF